MTKKIISTSTMIAVIAAVLLLFFDIRISIGIITGNLFASLYFVFLTLSMNSLFQNERPRFFSVLAHFFRYLLLALPLLLGGLFPKVINIFGSFVGEMILRATIFYVGYMGKEVPK